MPRSDCVYRGERTIQGENISPFVHLSLGKYGFRKGEWISVGNISTSETFHSEAVIKSFEIGSSDGVSCSVEILDERGGAFDRSVREMFVGLQTKKGESEGSGLAALWWGWVITNCDTGATRLEKAGPIYLSMIKMQVTFSGGKVKYKIDCKDIISGTKDITSEDSIWGDDENPMGIKDALKNMMEDTDPKINIKWLNKDGKSDVEFRDNPKAVWETNGLDKLSSIAQWLENFVTTNDRGIIPIWDYTKIKPTLLLVEAPDLEVQENRNKFKGIYIVNGGKNSNVISFNPTFNWPAFYEFASDTGGEAGNPASGKMEWKNDESVKPKNKKSENLGKRQTVTTNRAAQWVHGKKAPEKINKNQVISSKAGAVINSAGPIEAELKIQGTVEERFWHPQPNIGGHAHIVLINPFHLRSSSGCEWLAEPVCNDMFTSKKWMIMGVSHSIKEGSFTTTLKVKLMPPYGGSGSDTLKSWNPEV
jgi:hypothetical protein